jgi:hypothetical protein
MELNLAYSHQDTKPSPDSEADAIIVYGTFLFQTEDASSTAAAFFGSLMGPTSMNTSFSTLNLIS